MTAGPSFSTNTNLSLLPEIDQKKDPGNYAELLRIRNAIRTLQAALDAYTGAGYRDPSLWPTTLPLQSLLLQNMCKMYAQTTEAMTFGQMVNFWDSGGLKARLADANPAYPCRAYCNVPAGLGIGDWGEFVLSGVLPATGVIPGADYYQSTTAGFITPVTPATPGTMFQPIGFGLDTESIWFVPSIDWYII